MKGRILVVDDEENIGLSLRLILEHSGYEVAVCQSAAEFQQEEPRLNSVDLFLLDVRLPDGNGIELLRRLRQSGIQAPVVMISGHASIGEAVEATRAGAFDFLEKPLSRDRVLLAVKNTLEQASLRQENERLKEIVGDGSRMIGASPAFRKVVEHATLAARSDASVLLLGESGTGKEMLAAHIHASSPVAHGPFVKVNCAAIPNELLESELFGHEKGAFTGAATVRRGKFELADRGSIFLDEIGDLQEASQAKLLRVLQEGEFHRVGGEKPLKVQVRVVSATNKNIPTLMAQGKFREDLYYRLCVVPIRVPPLRERPEDIRALSEYFLQEFCARNNFRPKVLSPEVFPVFSRYNWPGNARELRNVVERMAILAPGDCLSPEAIPFEIRLPLSSAPSQLQEAREGAERDVLRRALEESGWNVSAAARTLGMERTNLHKRIRALGLRRGEQN